MLRLSIILPLVFVISNLSAQEEEDKSNNWFVGGSVNFSSNSTDNDQNYKAYSISPNIGYQLKDNKVIGLLLSVINFKRNNSQSVRKSTGVGVFYRYIFNPTKSFQFFLQPRIFYSRGNRVITGNFGTSSDRDINLWNLGLGAGLSYDISSRWRIRTSVGGINYTTSKVEDSPKDKTLNFDLFPSSLTTGIEFKF